MSEITQISVDFSSPEQTICFAQEFIDQYGVPDLLINNAGYGAFYEWAEFPDFEINNQIEVLFSAPVRLCRIIAPSMQKECRGLILNLSSIATLYPLPYMPLYNAGKSALSSFTENMMLEYRNFPKFIDFRMGDVRTGFNTSASRQKTINQSMNLAWAQIEKQLDDSISVETAVEQVFSRIKRGESGTFFGGSFFQRIVLPILFRVLPNRLRLAFVRYWYAN